MNAVTAPCQENDMLVTWTRVAGVLALFALSGVLFAGRAQAQSSYALALSHAVQSVDSSGRNVVTMMARGDLQGALTMRLERTGDGTVTGGEWALSVSYTEIVRSPAPAVGGGEDDPGERLVQKGVLKGTVVGGRVGFSRDGSIATMSGIRLALTGGTLEFSGVASGGGTMDAASMANRDASSGSIALAF